jgi:hypothetical protein
MQFNTCAVLGQLLERRIRYVTKHVRPGTTLTLQYESNDPHPSEGLSLYHEGRKIGFIPEDASIRQSLEAGNHHEVAVQRLIQGGDGTLSGIEIAVSAVAGGRPSDSPPAPNPVVAAIGDELKILGAVARAGGRFSRTERDLIAKYAEVRCNELEVAATAGEIVASLRWLKRNLPDEQGLVAAIAALIRPDAFDAMLEMSEIIAETGGPTGAEKNSVATKVRTLISEQRAKVAA